jgi:HSP20 family protein
METNERTDRELRLPTSRERTNEAGSASTPSRGRLVGYGPSGNSQALMRHMADDIDQLLQLFGFGSLGLGTGAIQATPIVWSPQIEVERRDGNLVVRADLPGVDPSDVNVEVDDGVLTISGERRDERREERDGSFRTERFYGRFHRAIPLPEGADDSRVEARFENGVLDVTIPVPEQEQRRPKRVEVKSSNQAKDNAKRVDQER